MVLVASSKDNVNHRVDPHTDGIHSEGPRARSLGSDAQRSRTYEENRPQEVPKNGLLIHGMDHEVNRTHPYHHLSAGTRQKSLVRDACQSNRG